MESKLKENIKVIPGGVTAAKGFEAAAAAAEIKYKGRTDMALIYSQTPCQTAGTFTSNIVKAAPVKWDQKIVAESPCAQAVVTVRKQLRNVRRCWASLRTQCWWPPPASSACSFPLTV